MKFTSEKDIPLLHNCILAEKEILKYNLNKKTSHPYATKENIEICTNILDNLRNKNLSSVQKILENSTNSNFINELNKSFSDNSSFAIVDKYLSATKELMIQNGKYSDEQFKKIVEKFTIGLEHFGISQDMFIDKYFENANQNSQFYLNKMDSLVKKSLSSRTTVNQFQNFASKFQALSLNFGKSKLQEAFNEQNKKINDMKISKSTDDNSNPIYKIDFSLTDKQTSQSSDFTLQESAGSKFISSYFKNLCVSYLEAKKYSSMNPELISSETIAKESSNFREYYKNFEEMDKCNIKLVGNKIIYTSESQCTPELTKEGQEQDDDDREIEFI